MYAENPKGGHEKSRLLSEKNKRLIWQRYVILHPLYRGAHGFEQKFIQAAGVSIFPEHGIPQVVEALDDYAVLGGCEVYLEFPFFHRAFLLCASIIYVRKQCRKCAIYNQIEADWQRYVSTFTLSFFSAERILSYSLRRGTRISLSQPE